MPRKRDEAGAARAVALYSSGQTARQVSTALGVHERTVRRWLDGQMRPRGPQPSAPKAAPAIRWQPSPYVRQWLEDYAARAGRPLAEILDEAVAAYRQGMCDYCERDLCELTTGRAPMPSPSCPHSCHRRDSSDGDE